MLKAMRVNPSGSQAAAESEDAAKESDALGGSVRNQMRNEVSPQKRYFGSFAGMSWISHGSVLALREISRAVESAGPDLLSCCRRRQWKRLASPCWLDRIETGWLHTRAFQIQSARR